MISVNVIFDNKTYKELGINDKEIDANTLLKLFRKKLALEAIDKCNQIAKKNGLSKLTMKDINKEIKTVRDAKNRNRH